MTGSSLAILCLGSCAAVLSAHAQNAASALGLQRAAVSGLQWEVREAGHPVLGDIRFAFLKTPVETAVGKDKVFSGAYLSCQKGSNKLAIEFTNTKSLDDAGGLRPSKMPRLICKQPAAPGDGKIVQEELATTWEVSEIGDAMARGFEAAALRACASIGVVQEVTLPAGWALKTALVVFDMPPYNRELDSVFTTCGEVSAYAPAAWRAASVIAGSKTNVRSLPNIHGAVVVQLEAGAAVLAQKAKGEWWRVKQKSGAAFDGYIRGDRLVFK